VGKLTIAPKLTNPSKVNHGEILLHETMVSVGPCPWRSMKRYFCVKPGKNCYVPTRRKTRCFPQPQKMCSYFGEKCAVNALSPSKKKMGRSCLKKNASFPPGENCAVHPRRKMCCSCPKKKKF